MSSLALRCLAGLSLLTGSMVLLVGLPAEAAVRLSAAGVRVGQYEKLEMTIQLDRTYQNPFDPREVSVVVELTGPDGKQVSVPAFYTQDYERRNVSRGGKTIAWLYPSGPTGWKARFAPSLVGAWSAAARVTDRQGSEVSNRVPFECAASQRRGYLAVAARDPYYLQFTTGEPFFAIGQNLAFIGEGQFVDVAKAETIFRKLGENGANYLRIWTCCEDWAMALEARKSAWGRSWGGKGDLVPMPGEEDKPAPRKCVKLSGETGKSIVAAPSHPVAVRPETNYVLSARLKTDGKAKLRAAVSNTQSAAVGSADKSWTALRQEFTTSKNQFWLDNVRLVLDAGGDVWLGELSLKEDRPGATELLWEADPNRPLPGAYNLLDCAMLDQVVSAAEQHGLYLQLCVVTRDLYMKHLKDAQSAEYQKAIDDVKNFMRYCVARWGYSTHVAAWEYFNEIDPGLPTDRFYTELGEYLEQIDVYRHLRTTSTWHPSKKDCRHAKLDIAQVHHYLRPTLGEAGRDEVAGVQKLSAFLRENGPNKPGMIGEYGLADDKWGLSPYMRQDERLEHFRHSLWASALSGTASTALFWWWDRLDPQDAYPHYKPLAKFLAGEPFGKTPFVPVGPTASSDKTRVLALKADDRVLLWAFNTAATWHEQLVEKKTPGEVRNLEVQLGDLHAGRWQVEWWNTRSGEVVHRATLSSNGGPLKLAVPAFTTDIAAKIVAAR